MEQLDALDWAEAPAVAGRRDGQASPGTGDSAWQSMRFASISEKESGT